jgi:rhodanese-related sulfurtransferase
MTAKISSVSPRELQARLSAGAPAVLLDVRTPPEFASVHIPGARLLPLDELDAAAFLAPAGSADKPIYVVCQTGGRARRAIEKFQRAGFAGCILLEGGTEAWVAAGLPVHRGESPVLPLMRQVQIVVGSVSALGAALALLVNPWFALLPLVTGCGLLVAGTTGFCGLALVLARMPWNKNGPGARTAGGQAQSLPPE